MVSVMSNKNKASKQQTHIEPRGVFDHHPLIIIIIDFVMVIKGASTPWLSPGLSFLSLFTSQIIFQVPIIIIIIIIIITIIILISITMFLTSVEISF